MIGSGVEMKECVAVVPADEVDWWTNSLKVWGADRFIVKTDHAKVMPEMAAAATTFLSYLQARRFTIGAVQRE